MKNLFYLCLTLLLATNHISAQTDSVREMSETTLHFEAATYVLLSSLAINFERKFFSSETEKIHLYGRAGLEYVDILGLIVCQGQRAFGGNVGVTMLTGKGNHHFEAYGGAFLGSFRSKNKNESPTSSCRSLGFRALPLIDLGYRFQKPESGFFFRAKVGVLGVGIGLGHAF